MRRVILILVTILLGALSLRDAVGEWARNQALMALARGEQPRAAPMLAGEDPATTLALASADLARNPAAALTGAGAAAREVLLRDPLAPAALHILGILAERRAPGSGLPAFRLAERLSRREIGNELVLERVAANHSDLADTVRHLDRALSVDPGLAPTLLGPLVPALTDPVIRAEFQRYGHRRWYPRLVMAAIDGNLAVTETTDLLTAMTARIPDLPHEYLADALFRRATDRNDLAGLQSLRNALPAAQRRAAANFAVTGATLDKRLSLLGWQLRADEAREADFAPPDGLNITISAERTEEVARRVTLLPAGHYVLAHAIAADADRPTAGLIWQLDCANPAIAIWRQPARPAVGSGRWAGAVDIPANCPIQHWSLLATSEDSQSGASVRISQLGLGVAR